MTMIADNRIMIALILIVVAGLVWWLWGRRSVLPVEKPDPALDKVQPVKLAEVEKEAKDAEKPTTKTVAAPKAKAAPKTKTPPMAKSPVSKKPAAVKKAKPEPFTPDNLMQLKGVGPKLVVLLDGLGVQQFSQIAAWTTDDVARIDAQLGNFSGRIVRDNWIEQADFLASGDISGFEAKFGKLDSENG